MPRKPGRAGRPGERVAAAGAVAAGVRLSLLRQVLAGVGTTLAVARAGCGVVGVDAARSAPRTPGPPVV
jgi:hypothetical protein